jgi:DNA-binding transcriptional LysR family regulator
MLDELQVFIVAVEEGSLTSAAARMNLTVATVSRRISALEDHLGCRLLHRSPRGLTMTSEGQAYFDECAEYVRSLHHRLKNLNEARNSLSGPLRVLAPTNFAVGPLDEFWRAFVTRYPDIELAVEVSNEFIDLKHAQADMAIRIGPQPDSSLIQKRLGCIWTVLVAKPGAFGDGSSLQAPDDLRNHPTVASRMISDWELANAAGEQVSLREKHKYVANDLSMATTLVKSGAGIALLPLSQVAGDLETGELMRVLPEWFGQNRDVHLIWPYRRVLSVRARVFMAMLEDFLGTRSWFESHP